MKLYTVHWSFNSPVQGRIEQSQNYLVIFNSRFSPRNVSEYHRKKIQTSGRPEAGDHTGATRGISATQLGAETFSKIQKSDIRGEWNIVQRRHNEVKSRSSTNIDRRETHWVEQGEPHFGLKEARIFRSKLANHEWKSCGNVRSLSLCSKLGGIIL